MDIVKFLRDEWQNLSAAPFTFLALLVIAFSLAYLLAKWRYDGIVDSLRERLQSRDDRITSKDEQLDEYRQKLKLVEPGQVASGSAFSRLANEELQRRTLLLVKQLREFIARTEREDRVQSETAWRKNASVGDEQKRSEEFLEETRASAERSLRRHQEYDEKFKVEAILLRDELRARLPSGSEKSRFTDSSFEHPVNFFCLREVADELEKMGRVLA